MPRTDIGRPQSTAATRRKHTKTSFTRLCDAKEITAEMMRAAIEIDQIYESLTRGLWVKPPSMERVSGNPRDEMPLKIAWAHRSRWLPWATALTMASKTKAFNPLSVVIDVLCDQRFISSVAAEHEVPHAEIKRAFLHSLLLYAVMAKWCQIGILTAWEKQYGKPRIKAPVAPMPQAEIVAVLS